MGEGRSGSTVAAASTRVTAQQNASLLRKGRATVRGGYLSLRRMLNRVVLDGPRGIETSMYVDLAELGLEHDDRVRYEPSGGVTCGGY